MAETVSIDPARAMRLSRACLEAALHLRHETELLLVQLREAGEDPVVLATALEASEWAAGGTRRVAAVVEAVATWPVPSGTCPVAWSSPAGRVDDDGAAASAGAEALIALRAGDLDRFFQLARDWADNSSFEAVFGSDLDVDDVVPWLLMATAPDAHLVRFDDGTTTVLDLVGFLADAVSTATTAGRAPFSLAQLLDTGADDGLTEAGAAMLFAAPGAETRSWSQAWLVDATALLVVPLTMQMRTGDARLVGRRWGDDLVDLRAPIFDALTRDPSSARAAFMRVDLSELVGGSAAYLDHGAAIAGALSAATRPDEADHHGAMLVMERFVLALSPGDPPPVLLTERLGAIAWPWIGSFRVDRADDRLGGVANLMPGPDEHALRSYLLLASASVQASTDLVHAVDSWVGYQLAVSGARVAPPQVLHDLGSVTRFVSEATWDAARAHAAVADVDRALDQSLFELAGNGIGYLVGRWWGDFADFTISNVLVPLVLEPHLLPDLDAEIEHLASVPASVARDQEVLEWQVLAHLWRRRAESGLFDSLPAPPATVVDPLGQLVPPSALDASSWDDYRRWRDLVADPTGLDNVGAAFGRDLAPRPRAGDPASDGGG